MADIIIESDLLKSGKLRYKHLVGKQFNMGKNDCYSILCAVFKDNFGIEFPNYARPNDWWLEENLNYYVDRYKATGFDLLEDPSLEDLRPFDVMLIAIPDPRDLTRVVTNHCAIYLGDGMVLHHRMGTLSSVVPYRGVLRNLTTHIVRHKDVPDLRAKTKTTLNAMDYILPHKREMLMGALNESSNNKETSN